MKIITKDYQEYKCLFIAFEGETVTVSLWDEQTTIELNISDIDYISHS